MDTYRQKAFEDELSRCQPHLADPLREIVRAGEAAVALVDALRTYRERVLRAEDVIEQLLRTRAPSIRMELKDRGAYREWEALCVAELELKRALEVAAASGVSIRWEGTKREVPT